MRDSTCIELFVVALDCNIASVIANFKAKRIKVKHEESNQSVGKKNCEGMGGNDST